MAELGLAFNLFFMDTVHVLLEGLALICSVFDHCTHLGSALKNELPVLLSVFAIGTVK